VTLMNNRFIVMSIILVFLPGLIGNVLAISDEDYHQFTSNFIEDLRNETNKAKGTEPYGDDVRVSLSNIDFQRSLLPYQHIHLKDGYRLDGFFLAQGMGSFSVPFAVPRDEPFILNYTNETPDGYVYPPFIQYYAGNNTGRILQIIDSDEEGQNVIALPEHADRQIMKYITGDDSPQSYLEASIFQREIEAIDAGWHARIGWPIEDVIPYEDTPSVTLNETHAIVRITTNQEYCGTRTIYQYMDVYTRPNLIPVSDLSVISTKEGEGFCY
jgi:hypothetical protein